MSNKFDFFFSKMANGQSRFSAVGSLQTPEFKGAQLVDLLQFVIHWRDLIEISGKDLLVNDDAKAAELKQKLIAAGFTIEPLKIQMR